MLYLLKNQLSKINAQIDWNLWEFYELIAISMKEKKTYHKNKLKILFSDTIIYYFLIHVVHVLNKNWKKLDIKKGAE